MKLVIHHCAYMQYVVICHLETTAYRYARIPLTSLYCRQSVCLPQNKEHTLHFSSSDHPGEPGHKRGSLLILLRFKGRSVSGVRFPVSV